jgi:hypothetical protein
MVAVRVGEANGGGCESPNDGRSSLSGLGDRACRVQLLYGLLTIGEFHSERVVGTPAHAALAEPTVARRELQRELIGKSGGSHAGDFRATIRKVAHNALTDTPSIVNCRRKIPLNSEVLASPSHH